MGISKTNRASLAMMRAVIVAVCVAVVVALPAEKEDLSVSETGELRHQIVDKLNVHHSLAQVGTQTTVYEDLGITEEELWDCGWYSGSVPRAAVSLAACKDYLETRLLNCVPWTHAYGEANPKAARHISLDEVHIKCKHVKDALDQETTIPGDLSTCSWCM